MKIKKVELKDFKRFTHLVVDNIPSSVKLIVVVGANGSGKSSFMEAMNHYYKYYGYYGYYGSEDFGYLYKGGKNTAYPDNLEQILSGSISIDFHDADFLKNTDKKDIRGCFYFRTAYRNEPDFVINSMNRQSDPKDRIRLARLIENDQTVSSNYQRLIASTISSIFDTKNNSETVENLRNKLVGKIKDAITNVFEDLQLSSLGEPLSDGSFYFTKGMIQNFHYRNLSAGEKAAFDLILDMVVQSQYYSNAVYCIDEPEIHMHTKLQGKVLRELYNLVPGESQLWVATHSIGMLQEASDIEKEHQGTVAFLDFGDRDFDEEQVIQPIHIDRAVLEKFYELTFGDFSKLILPKKIVFCEGNSDGKTRKNFDKTIYSQIFSATHPEVFFISGGACSDIENIETKHGEILNTLLKNTETIKIVDRDDRSEKEVQELLEKGIKTTGKRHLESYLLDDEIIKRLCEKQCQLDKYEDCIKAKEEAIASSVARGNPLDDVKSASGEIYTALKRILMLQRCGNNKDAFIRDTMAPLVTPDTKVYKLIEKDIFGGNN